MENSLFGVTKLSGEGEGGGGGEGNEGMNPKPIQNCFRRRVLCIVCSNYLEGSFHRVPSSFVLHRTCEIVLRKVYLKGRSHL